MVHHDEHDRLNQLLIDLFAPRYPLSGVLKDSPIEQSYIDVVRVEFFKLERNGRHTVGWDAVRGKRTHIPGTVMAAQKNLPHDLLQYVVEAACGFDQGFWGLLARGATFKSTGRRSTRPGRALIAAHRPALAQAEALAEMYRRAWMAGEQTPVTDALNRIKATWDHISPGDRLVFEWPSPKGAVRTEGVQHETPSQSDPAQIR